MMIKVSNAVYLKDLRMHTR